MKFTNTKGQLLPMTDILDKVKLKFADASGNLTDLNKSKVMKAFGETGGKAVMNLLDKTNALRTSITDLNAVKGNFPVVEMPQKMTDASERFESTLNVIKVTLGASLLPILNSVFNVMSTGLSVFGWFLDNIPPLRWAIAAVTLAVFSCTAALRASRAILDAKKIISALISEIRLLTVWSHSHSKAIHAGTLAHKLATAWMWIYQGALGRTVLFEKAYTGAKTIGTMITQKGIFWEKAVAMWKWANSLVTLKGSFCYFGKCRSDKVTDDGPESCLDR